MTTSQQEVYANAPLVSILMLTYNRANYIGEAIASVLSQTYQNWELIIIDDGSTDDTESEAKRIGDPRIRYIKHEANAGLSIRRPESLTYVQGKYIAVLDSDDLWLSPRKLEEQVAYLEANPECGVVGTAAKSINAQGELGTLIQYKTTDSGIRKKILLGAQFVHSSVLMRTAALQKTAGYRFPIAEDFDLFLQLGRQGTLANLSEAMTGYRIHPQSETAKQLKMIKSALQIIKIHKTHYPNYYLGYLKYSLYYLLLCLRSSRKSGCCGKRCRS